jgi:hypothetical protein
MAGDKLRKGNPTITDLNNPNRPSGEVYSIQHYVIKFVSDLQQVDGFLHQENLPPRYN